MLSDRNSRVIREMKRPNSAAEVQGLIGRGRTSHRLDSQGCLVAGQGPKEQGSFDEVKRALLESTAVYKPNSEHHGLQRAGQCGQ